MPLEKPITLIKFTEEDLNGSIPDRFLKVLKGLPEGHIAYKDQAGALTYQQLYNASMALASRLMKEIPHIQEHRQELVALLLEPEWHELQCLMGVAFAGHYYLALDLGEDESQLQNIMAAHPFKVLVTTTKLKDIAERLLNFKPDCRLIYLDELSDESERINFPLLNTRSYQTVYFTSGSTGKPRGVIRTHGTGLITAYISASELNICPDDRITLTSSFAIGMSVTPTLGALMNGATICRRLDAISNPVLFRQWLIDDQITIARASAGLIRSLIGLPDIGTPLSDLRLIDTGGESFTRAEIEKLLTLMPDGGSFNVRLASNEAGNYAMFRVQAGEAWSGERNPVGYPPPFITVFVVDDDRNILPAGAEGEIAVRSKYLAAGYLNDSEQTQARFIDDPDGGEERIYYTGDLGTMSEDGLIEFNGRKDLRVKIRGYTIGLEVVDAALKGIERIQDAVVTVQTLPNGNKRLIGYLVPEEGQTISISRIRRELRKEIPQYMIPAVLLKTESLPTTVTGKVDRKALQPPELTRPDLDVPYHEPRFEEEKRFVQIWERILGVAPVGIEDSFFELGGDSLMSMQMIMEIETTCGCKIPQEFFKIPTIVNLIYLIHSQSQETEPEFEGRQPGENDEVVRIEKMSLRGLLAKLGLKLTHPADLWYSLVLRVRKPYIKKMMKMNYSEGMAWLIEWVQKPVVQVTLFGREKKIFKSFLKSLGIEEETRPGVFNRVLVGNLWANSSPKLKEVGKETGYLGSGDRFWREFGEIVEKVSPETKSQFIDIRGYEHLEKAYQEGRGVILLSYHGTVTKLPAVLIEKWLGCPPIHVISPRVSIWREMKSSRRNIKLENIQLQINTQQSRHGAYALLQGYRMLTQGEIVRVYVDNGLTSRGDWEIEVCGKRYMTRAGWADLAYHTGAAVIPLVGRLQNDGCVQLNFMPAIKLNDKDKKFDEQMQELLAQYADFLSTSYQNYPESVRWKIMENHVKSPSLKMKKLD